MSECTVQHSDSVVAKIKKLLELASSERNPSAHEAELAMAKAQDLMLKHDLELVDLKEKPKEDSFDKHFVGQPYRRAPASQKFIATLIQRHFHVCVLYSRVVLSPGKMPCTYSRKGKFIHRHDIPEYAGMTGSEREWLRGMQLLGRKTNILIAEYVHDYLSGEFERLWRRHQEETGKGAYAKLDFFEGLFRGLDQRLNDERRRCERAITPEQSEELVKRSEKEALASYLHQEFPSINHRRDSWRETRDVDSFKEGMGAGQNINIRPAVNESNGTKSLPAARKSFRSSGRSGPMSEGSGA